MPRNRLPLPLPLSPKLTPPPPRSNTLKMATNTGSSLMKMRRRRTPRTMTRKTQATSAKNSSRDLLKKSREALLALSISQMMIPSVPKRSPRSRKLTTVSAARRALPSKPSR